MEFLQKYALYVVLGFNLLLAWAHWSMPRAFATKAELQAVDAKVVALDARANAIETALGQLPNKEDLHDLKLKLTETVGDLKAMRAVVQVERNHIAEQQRRFEDALARHDSIFSDAARNQT